MVEWTSELKEGLDQLTAGQRRAIARIVTAEAEGQPFTRLLKTPYSCQYCGFVAGHSSDSRDQRKAELAAHEVECDRQGRPWPFICTLTTYYSKWMKISTFSFCLHKAREEFTSSALGQAARMLQLATPDAAAELARQIKHGEKDVDRRSAAVAILDRAEVGRVPDSLETDWWEAVDDDEG